MSQTMKLGRIGAQLFTPPYRDDFALVVRAARLTSKSIGPRPAALFGSRSLTPNVTVDHPLGIQRPTRASTKP